MRHFYSTELFALEAIFLFHFFEKDLNFWGILSVPHLADIYAKNMDERGRNFMCERTLPRLLLHVQDTMTSKY